MRDRRACRRALMLAAVFARTELLSAFAAAPVN
jgi:hypothetical protein